MRVVEIKKDKNIRCIKVLSSCYLNKYTVWQQRMRIRRMKAAKIKRAQIKRCQDEQRKENGLMMMIM